MRQSSTFECNRWNKGSEESTNFINGVPFKIVINGWLSSSVTNNQGVLLNA